MVCVTDTFSIAQMVSHDLPYLNDFQGIGKAIDTVLILLGDNRHVVGLQKTPVLQYADYSVKIVDFSYSYHFYPIGSSENTAQAMQSALKSPPITQWQDQRFS
jgi:hypothetical protein